eukprot:TRINITY_DN2296_c0_g1_i1.p1 TRINITY_DN2296_c0_g1~~TRINITY_DN2296_c0_g1_i1.p1  ORF type:complete len:1111 (+),score=479.97 TRINITY_DN2296_c0_g1_i1:13-3345(+)
MDSERPLPLITFDNKKGLWNIGNEAKSMISRLSAPLGIIAVAGLYRTGKSYVLNRLLDRQSGFDIGSTINACTKGIYVWSKPIVLKKNNKTFNILLIDTEGLGSFDQDSKHDAQIFSLALLLSSYFIYNSMGTIDEQALDKLSLVCNLSKHIHVKDNDKSDNQDLSPFLPKFLWLVRDFSLQLVDMNNKPITSREYLETALNYKSKIESKNEIREFIRKYFPERDCVTLPRPVVEETQLQKLDSIPYNDLRQNFKEMMNNLKNKVFNEVTEKNLNGSSISGTGYICLMDNYLNAINKGAVPSIQSAWSNITALENQKLLVNTIRRYVELMSQKVKQLPIEEDLMNKIEHSTRAEVYIYFEKNALGETQKLLTMREDLNEKLSKEFEAIQTKNREESRIHCQKALVLLYKPIESDLQNNKFETIDNLCDAWRNFQEKYSKEAIGVHKLSLLTEFLMVKMCDTLVRFMRNKLDSLLKEAENKLKLQKKEYEEKIKDIESEKKDLKDEIKEVRQQHRESEQENKKKLEKLESDYKSHVLKLNQEHEKNIKHVQENVEQLRLNSQQYTQKIKEQQEELSNLRVLKKSLEEKETKVNMLEKEFSDMKSNYEKLGQKFIENQKTTNQNQEKLNQENKNLLSKLQKISEGKENSDKESTSLKEKVNEKEKKLQNLNQELEKLKLSFEQKSSLQSLSENEYKQKLQNSLNEITQLKEILKNNNENLTLLEKVEDENKKLKRNLEDLTGDLEKSKKIHRDLTQKLQDTEDEVSKLNNNIKTETNNSSSKIEKVEKENKQLKNEVEDLRESLEKQNKNNKVLSKNNSELSQKLQNTENQVSQLNDNSSSKIEKFERENKKLKNDLEDLKESLENQKRNNQELSVKLQNAGNQVSDHKNLKSDMENMKRNLMELQQQNEKSNKENYLLTEDLRKQKVIFQEQKEELERKYRNLENEKNKLVSEKNSIIENNTNNNTNSNSGKRSVRESELDSEMADSSYDETSSKKKTTKRKNNSQKESSPKKQKNTEETSNKKKVVTKKKKEESEESEDYDNDGVFSEEEVKKIKEKKPSAKKPTEDYKKMTIAELKKAIAKANHQDKLPLKQGKKDDYIKLYEKYVIED